MSDSYRKEHMTQSVYSENGLNIIAESSPHEKTQVLLIEKSGENLISYHAVNSKSSWQSTGVNVAPGFPVKIIASGLWNVHPRAYPNGHGPEGTGVSCPAGYALPGGSEGSLVGRFGPGGKPFPIGRAYAETAAGGVLYLVINDDLGGAYGGGLSDNNGSINVSIEI